MRVTGLYILSFPLFEALLQFKAISEDGTVSLAVLSSQQYLLLAFSCYPVTNVTIAFQSCSPRQSTRSAENCTREHALLSDD